MTVDNTTIDYSQPIVMAAHRPRFRRSAAPMARDQSLAADQACDSSTRPAPPSLQGDYAGALSPCENAIAKLPNDAVLHEFRGLALFALHRYKEAAGADLCRAVGWPRLGLDHAEQPLSEH